ncbi:hypothetical protein BaRGS_00005859, partial [Batillaria attramentaria]
MSRLPVLLIVMAVIVCCWGDYSPFRNKINNLGPAAKNILDNMAALSKVKRGGSDELDDEGGSCTCPPAIDGSRCTFTDSTAGIIPADNAGVGTLVFESILFSTPQVCKRICSLDQQCTGTAESAGELPICLLFNGEPEFFFRDDSLTYSTCNAGRCVRMDHRPCHEDKQ